MSRHDDRRRVRHMLDHAVEAIDMAGHQSLKGEPYWP